jgi:hypothetical protein
VSSKKTRIMCEGCHSKLHPVYKGRSGGRGFNGRSEGLLARVEMGTCITMHEPVVPCAVTRSILEKSVIRLANLLG